MDEERKEPSNVKGRGPDGRFVKGCRGGPGGQAHAYSKARQELRRMVTQHANPERIRKALDMLYEKGITGDVRCMELYLRWSVSSVPGPEAGYSDAQKVENLDKPEAITKVLEQAYQGILDGTLPTDKARSLVEIGRAYLDATSLNELSKKVQAIQELLGDKWTDA